MCIYLCMGRVGGWDNKWTDSGSLKKNCKISPEKAQWRVSNHVQLQLQLKSSAEDFLRLHNTKKIRQESLCILYGCLPLGTLTVNKWVSGPALEWKGVYLRIDGVIGPISMQGICLSTPDDLLCVIQHETSKDYQAAICSNRLQARTYCCGRREE